MNFDGFQPHEINRFSSLVEQDDATNLPLGVSALARNVKFHLTSVRTRDGIQNRYGFTLPDDGAAVTGLAALKMGNPNLQVPIAFSSLGTLYKESPAGSGNVLPISGPLVSLPSGASMQVAAAFTKGFLAFSDLVNSLSSPAVYNIALDTLDPLSMRPVGDPWAPNTTYQVGEVVTPATPIGGTGHSYQCTGAGKSGATQPPEFASSSQTKLAGAGSQSGAGTAWTNPNNVTLNDGVGFATVSLTGSLAGDVSSKALLASTFGFTIPGLTILGIIVTGVAFQSGVKGRLDLQIIGASGSLGYSVFPTAQGTQFSLGSATTTWLSNPSPTQANDPGFGVQIKAVEPAGNPETSVISLQNINIQIVYGVPAGAVVDDGLVTWTENTPAISSSALAGNIPQGLRYLVVLFVNRNGYISGMTQASVVSQNIVDSVHQLTVSPIPIGPSNTVARICAFTPAGQLGLLAGTGISSAGPYFWVEPSATFFGNGVFNLTSVPGGVTVADVVSGVTMNSTLINDNTTTTATFNFTDDYLKQTLNDVSPYFRKIKVPNCSDVWYSKSLRRMFYAADNLPSGWYVSLADDPESVYGDKGLIQVAENNGENRTAIREFAGVVYPMKERSGHVLTPSADDPSTWDVVEQWSGSGPCGPRAVDVCTKFMCYVHRSGVYIFQGGQPFLISKEIPITWAGINWKYQQTIWVLIDDETREIRIGVPFGQSTVPNMVLKLNYEEAPSFEPPIHFSPYMGKEIAAGECYKWSVDDIAANLAIRAERALVGPPVGLDSATTQSQILYASSNPDGHVDPIIPMAFDDNGAGIDSVYETAAPQDLLRPNQLGGVQANIDGLGQIQLEILAFRAKDQKQGGVPTQGGKTSANAGFVKKLAKPCQAGIPYSCGAAGQNERFRLRVSNTKTVGTWFDIKWCSIYARPLSSGRPN